MNKIIAPSGAIDVCGTGGDSSGTFNISTTVAFVVASCGVPVAKHGGRASSSKCGSIDLLEELKIPFLDDPKKSEELLDKLNIAFLHANTYHPAMKNIAQIRKDLAIRTIFNLVGPFSNPAGVRKQIVGVPSKKIAEKLSFVARELDYENIFIISSGEGLDEISLDSPTYVYNIKGKNISNFIINPQKLGFKASSLERLRGGSSQLNAKILKEILNGDEKGPKHDIVVINSAYALLVAGKVETAEEGVLMAKEAINSGKAKNIFEKLKKTD